MCGHRSGRATRVGREEGHRMANPRPVDGDVFLCCRGCPRHLTGEARSHPPAHAPDQRRGGMEPAHPLPRHCGQVAAGREVRELRRRNLREGD
eukprot:15444455-Alexandrium_andersonii.AAC.1